MLFQDVINILESTETIVLESNGVSLTATPKFGTIHSQSSWIYKVYLDGEEPKQTYNLSDAINIYKSFATK